MSEESSADFEGRVLLLPPTRRDAAAATFIFEKIGIPLSVCQDISTVCAEMERGAAVAIIPDEAVLNDRQKWLVRFLKDQPPWSDFPLIVLISPHQTLEAARELEAVGHMTLVRRPVEIRSLVSNVQAAIRDRQRQYARRADFIERERQTYALRANDRQKDEFLAMLAHELRNPLAAVNNAVTILKRTADEESRIWAGDVVERQVRQLVRLIEDLLDASRITSGKIRLRKEFADASAALDPAIEAARPLIDERRHTLTLSIERGRLPLHIDVTRIGQIALNLLTNAAKYTENGGSLRLVARREGDEVVISVQDNGVGIAPERLPEMFLLFAQGDRSLARSEGGLGIGLTIVKNLTELHGGSVTARSEGAGLGSEFIVRLPVTEESGEAKPGSQLKGPAADKPHRILVVDDNEDTAFGIERLLKSLGNVVASVHDGPTALETAHTFRPDFVLLDIGLPGMDGYKVAVALREDEVCKDVVIIAVSGYGQDEDRRKSQAAGFDHHLVKPVNFDSLVSLIDSPT